MPNLLYIVTVIYEECPINKGNGFNFVTGEFIAKENGTYDFSTTFLMKTDENGSVIVKLKKGTVSNIKISFYNFLFYGLRLGYEVTEKLGRCLGKILNNYVLPSEYM